MRISDWSSDVCSTDLLFDPVGKTEFQTADTGLAGKRRCGGEPKLHPDTLTTRRGGGYATSAWPGCVSLNRPSRAAWRGHAVATAAAPPARRSAPSACPTDRKSTRLNSSH